MVREETRGFVDRGDWELAGPEHFVELFEVLHEQVYGVPPSLTREDRRRARFAVAGMLRESFGGDALEFSRFVRWTWLRERETEEWRRANRRDGGHLTWRLAFSRDRLTAYRVARARRRA